MAVLVQQMYLDGQRQIEKDTLATARALGQAVDGQLDRAKVVATALESSNFLATGDMPAFQRRARDLLAANVA